MKCSSDVPQRKKATECHVHGHCKINVLCASKLEEDVQWLYNGTMMKMRDVFKIMLRYYDDVSAMIL